MTNFMIKLLASYAKTSNSIIDVNNKEMKSDIKSSTIKDKNILYNEYAPKLSTRFWKNYLKYSFKDLKESKYDCELFLNYPTYKTLLFTWNLGETKVAKMTRSLKIQKINWVKKFYLSPKTFDLLFPENNIDSEMSDEVKISKKQPKILSSNELFPSNIFEEKKNSVRIRFITNLEFDFNDLFFKYISKNNNNFDINILKKYNNKQLIFKNILEKTNPNIKLQDLRNNFKKVIIHFHGGAFVAMSSSTHQVYLRKISNNLNIPIFSIDYRLAPVAKHPHLLYDCILGYFWVYQFVKYIIGVENPEIILLGDSAGGNLALTTCLWILENELNPPISLHLNYPCLCLRYDTYTPSMFIAFNDLFLNYNGMKISLDLYLNENSDCEKDSYLSPLYMKDKYFKILPKIFLNCGTYDPLINDCFRFIKRKIDNKKEDLIFDCFKYLPHGLCGMDQWNPGKIFHFNIEKHLKSVINN